MKRKSFINSLAILGASAAFHRGLQAADVQQNSPLIKPSRLQPGDTVGIIAPAGIIAQKDVDESVTNLKNLGFTVKPGKNILQKNGYFAGTDKERADDVMAMFADDDVKGIVCIRGGYGIARIFPLLNFSFIRKHPKPLIGYSDITALHQALYVKAGLISYHGPVGTSTYNDFSVQNFKKTLMYPASETVFTKAESDGDKPESKLFTVRSGTCTGWLAGGNLSLLVSLIGTEYDVTYKGALLYIEEVGEEPYRIDRMLTQMEQAGKFDGVQGIALGIFKNCSPKEKESGITNSFSLQEVLLDRLYHLNIPVIYGLSFGHVENKLVLPYGCRAELNTSPATLTLLEPATV